MGTVVLGVLMLPSVTEERAAARLEHSLRPWRRERARASRVSRLQIGPVATALRLIPLEPTTWVTKGSQEGDDSALYCGVIQQSG